MLFHACSAILIPRNSKGQETVLLLEFIQLIVFSSLTYSSLYIRLEFKDQGKNEGTKQESKSILMVVIPAVAVVVGTTIFLLAVVYVLSRRRFTAEITQKEISPGN